jgi:hypothetical protein
VEGGDSDLATEGKEHESINTSHGTNSSIPVHTESKLPLSLKPLLPVEREKQNKTQIKKRSMVGYSETLVMSIVSF